MSGDGQLPTALPPVATEVMESLYQHRLLSSTQVRRLHMPNASMSYTRALLGALVDTGVAGYAPAAGRLKLWYLTERGGDAIESIAAPGESRRRHVTPEQAAGPLRAHTLAVNDVGASFVEAARARGDDCGPLSWRHEIAHPMSPPRGRRPAELLIADALLGYTQRLGDKLKLHQRFIELDRATIPVQALADKLARYARLRVYRPESREPGARRPAWQEHYPEFPAVLVAFTCRETTRLGQRSKDRVMLERRMQNLIALHRADGRCHELQVLLVLLEELKGGGPYATKFIDPQHPERFVDWLGQPRSPQR